MPGQNLYFMFNAISMSVETVHCQQVIFLFRHCCCLMSYRGWFVGSRVWQLEPARWQCAEPQQSCDRARNVKPVRQHDAKDKKLQQRCHFLEAIFKCMSMAKHGRLLNRVNRAECSQGSCCCQ